MTHPAAIALAQIAENTTPGSLRAMRAAAPDIAELAGGTQVRALAPRVNTERSVAMNWGDDRIVATFGLPRVDGVARAERPMALVGFAVVATRGPSGGWVSASSEGMAAPKLHRPGSCWWETAGLGGFPHRRR